MGPAGPVHGRRGRDHVVLGGHRRGDARRSVLGGPAQLLDQMLPVASRAQRLMPGCRRTITEAIGAVVAPAGVPLGQTTPRDTGLGCHMRDGTPRIHPLTQPSAPQTASAVHLDGPPRLRSSLATSAIEVPRSVTRRSDSHEFLYRAHCVIAMADIN